MWKTANGTYLSPSRSPMTRSLATDKESTLEDSDDDTNPQSISDDASDITEENFLSIKDFNTLKDINSEERKDKRIIRKLKRELTESKQTLDELETTNGRLRKRVDDVLKTNEKFRAKFQ